MNKITQKINKEISKKLVAKYTVENWYKEELKESNTEFIKWLVERK